MLSIVIPTYQCFDLLRICLASVVRHAPAGTDIVVVDDASPGGRAGAVVGDFAGVRVVRRDKRGGFAAAVNAGIRASRGEVVELLNDDAEVTENWAGPALHWFNDPRVGAVAPLVLAWPDGERIDSAGDRYYLGGVAAKRGHGHVPGPDFDRPREVFGASAAAAFYRRSALERVGLFPESFGSYFEDVDLAFRLQRAGYKTMFEPAARVLHRCSASHGTTDRRLLEQQSRNEERVFWRNLPARDLWQALPKHGAVLLAKAWRRWQEGTLAPFLWGRLRLLGEIEDVMRHRRDMRRLGPETSAPDWGVETEYWGET